MNNVFVCLFIGRYLRKYGANVEAKECAMAKKYFIYVGIGIEML